MAPPASRAGAAAPLAKELEPYRDLGIQNLTVWLPTQPRGESLQFLDELHAEVTKLGWRVWTCHVAKSRIAVRTVARR
jgi:hypothetical protein